MDDNNNGSMMPPPQDFYQQAPPPLPQQQMPPLPQQQMPPPQRPPQMPPPQQMLRPAIDMAAASFKGEFIAGTWQMPVSAVPFGLSAVNGVRDKNSIQKYAWVWFLIPAITLLLFLIDQLSK